MSTDPNQQAIDELKAEIEPLTTVVTSAIALIEGMADRFEQVADDPEQVRAVVASIRSQSDALAAAVAAHTEE